MTSTPRPRYTLLIPTYNRPAQLRSLIGYLGAQRFKYPIRVLDSSRPETLAQNRGTVCETRLDIVHQTYDTKTPATIKFADGIKSVETPYCSFCPDDDILFTRQLDEILDALDANSSLAAAHGDYINFKASDNFDISDIFYWAPSITAHDPLKRIVEQMSNYQAIFYAIHRTDVMRSVQSQLGRVQSLLAHELLSSSLTLIAGGVYRLPHFYMARNTAPSIPNQGWHPYHFLATKPESLFQEYEAYRTIVVEHLLADTKCRAIYQPEQLKRILDLVHLKYLTPMISPPIIDYILAESLHAGTEPRDILIGIRDTFENAPEAGALRRLLRQLRQIILQPRYAKRLLKNAFRTLQLFAALSVQGNSKVRVRPTTGKIFVQRTLRDGQSRCYVLFRDFLQRQLTGGRRVTAAQTSNILEQLDSYV